VAGLAVMWFIHDPQVRSWCDGLTALGLAAYILVVGARLTREALHGLLDEVDPQAVGRVVAAINQVRDPAWRDVHNLRLRRAGDFTYVDFHLVVPSLWSVAAAHAAVERLEAHILATLGAKGAVMIHLDHPHADPTIGVDPPPRPEEVIPFTVAQASRAGDRPRPGRGPQAPGVESLASCHRGVALTALVVLLVFPRSATGPQARRHMAPAFLFLRRVPRRVPSPWTSRPSEKSPN
jgi:hypothetical protein